MKKCVMVAPVGKKAESVLLGIRDFPTERLVLLVPKARMNVARKIAKYVEKFRIKVVFVPIEGNMWEALFEKVGKIKKVEEGKEVIVNTSSADRGTQCALTSAAFVNGVKAFAIENGETMLLPILKFSYYKLLTDKKMNLLKLLYNDRTCCPSLEELSKKSKMSLPLVSYHVNGTRKSEGLKKLGLIEINEDRGKKGVHLSMMGELLIKGYVQP